MYNNMFKTLSSKLILLSVTLILTIVTTIFMFNSQINTIKMQMDNHQEGKAQALGLHRLVTKFLGKKPENKELPAERNLMNTKQKNVQKVHETRELEKIKKQNNKEKRTKQKIIEQRQSDQKQKQEKAENRSNIEIKEQK